jgi:hypothetical protein
MTELLEGIVTPRVFLKTDTQGFDLQVLRGASECLDRIIGIIAELSVIPIYKESPPFEEAIRCYRDAGFDLVDLSVVNRTIDGRVLEYDGLFIRRSSGARKKGRGLYPSDAMLYQVANPRIRVRVTSPRK